MRVGYEFNFFPTIYRYTVDDLGQTSSGFDVPDLDLNAKIKTGGFHLLFDYTPFKQGMGAFHITAGFYVGNNKIFMVNGQFDKDFIHALEQAGIDPSTEVSVDFGDSHVYSDAKGTIKAYLGVNSFKPYFGIGWGNAIPKGRVGFRFDMGVVYHGKPELKSPTIKLGREDRTEDVDKFYDVVEKVQVLPQITLQLTYRILNEEKYRKNKRVGED